MKKSNGIKKSEWTNKLEQAFDVVSEYLGRHNDLSPADLLNMKDSPRRVARAFQELTKTKTEIKRELKSIISKSFPTEDSGIAGMVTQGPIEILSLCPHHWMTVKYEGFVSYLPSKGGMVLGLSKLVRLSQLLGQRPVLQEQLAADIADVLHSGDTPNSVGWPSIQSDGSAVILIGNHSCFDGDTEILTEKGWQKFSSLKEGVRVAQVDYNNDMKTSLVLPTKYIRQKNSFDHLLHFKNRCISLMMTPDHRVIHQTSWKYNPNGNWDVLPANELNAEIYIPKKIKWVENTTRIGNTVFGEHTLTAEQFISLLGLYFSEGCWRGEGSWLDIARGKKGIEIVQKDGTKEDSKIDKFISSLPFKVDKYTADNGGNHYIINSPELAIYLRQFGRLCIKMRIPRKIKNAPLDQLNLFLDWFYLGDGDKWHLRKENHRLYKRVRGEIISTASKKLARDLQEIYFKCGIDTHIHIYEGKSYQNYFNKYRIWQQMGKGSNNTESGKEAAFFSSSRNKPTKVKHKGMVYCVSVPTGAIVVRRDNLISVVGNCMSCRGVKSNALTTVTELRGAFWQNDMELKFYQYVEACRASSLR